MLNIAIVPDENLFDESDEEIFIGNKEPLLILSKEARKNGFTLKNASDYNSINDIDVIIVWYNFYGCVDFLLKSIKCKSSIKIIYYMIEPENVEPLNIREISKNDLFDLIFTYNDKYINDKKFKKLNLCVKRSKRSVKNKFSEREFLIFLGGYKLSRFSVKNERDGYLQRLNALKYFSRKKVIDIFGIRWDRVKERSIHDSYRGTVKYKSEALSLYKFGLCIENEIGTPGYISEKIFDHFYNGCIPIYKGAPNIQEHIPYNCYIDMRKFCSYDDIYEYISKMEQYEYNEYLENIDRFLSSPEYENFTGDHFAKTIVRNLYEIKSSNEKKKFFKIKIQLLVMMIRYPYRVVSKKRRGLPIDWLTIW